MVFLGMFVLDKLYQKSKLKEEISNRTKANIVQHYGTLPTSFSSCLSTTEGHLGSGVRLEALMGTSAFYAKQVPISH